MRKFLMLMACISWLSGCTPYPEPPNPPLDPTTIERTGRPNDYLVCSEGKCSALRDAAAPSFDMPVEQLHAQWLELIQALPRVRVVAFDANTGLIHAEQRSKIFRFVDTILIKTMEENGRASFALYSRSELGYGDMGVNKARIESLLAELQNRLNS